MKEEFKKTAVADKLNDPNWVCMLKEQYEEKQKAFSEAQATIKNLYADYHKLEHENRCLTEEIASLRCKNLELTDNLNIKSIKCKRLIAALGEIESTVNKASNLYYQDNFTA